jgi:hypothetical protein
LTGRVVEAAGWAAAAAAVAARPNAVIQPMAAIEIGDAARLR